MSELGGVINGLEIEGCDCDPRESGVVAGVTVEALLLPTSIRKKVRGVAWSLGVLLLFAANSGLGPASWGRTPVDSFLPSPRSSPVFHCFHCGYYYVLRVQSKERRLRTNDGESGRNTVQISGFNTVLLPQTPAT